MKKELKTISENERSGDIMLSCPFVGFEVLDVYTKEQAIKDSMLVDVSVMAKEVCAVWSAFNRLQKNKKSPTKRSG